DIYDSTGSILVRKLVNSQNMIAGENIVSWGGTDNSGKVVADGTYVIKITGKTPDGKKDVIPVMGNIIVDATAPKLIVPSPDISLVKGKGTISEIKISYGCSEKAEIEYEISSNEDGVVFKGTNSISDFSKQYQFAWNGKDGKGNTVKTRKHYSYKITAKDAAGNVGIYSGSFITDGIEPEIKNARISKPIFSPIMNYPTEISFEVSDNIFDPLSNLKIEIRDLDNNVVKILEYAKSISAGAIESTWDGKDEKGNIVPDGKYKIAASVEDGVGNKAEYFAEVETDTVPPVPTMSQNLYAFSPNGDGKYDSVDFTLKSNEKGRIYVAVTSNQITETRNLVNLEISAEAEKEVKLTWTKDSFNLYRRDPNSGFWLLVSGFSINEKLSDGAYNVTVYAIDEAGNISENVINKTIVDTTPPTILGLNADPNPFTPNDDGIKDTTKFWYKFSEPAYVTLNIYRDDGRLFRSREGPTENFTYPTLVLSAYSLVPSAGEWQWDGRGSRNELLGGTYSWEVKAEDWVGNVVTSEVRFIVVDREPTLIPYAYAEPDPFSPVNPNNSFTNITYYLGRDNLKVSVAIVGEGEKPIKRLINDEVQNKGEHVVRWYGDYDPDYQGPTAQKNRYRVFDGSYEFQVRAVDPDALNPAKVSNTVLVDNTPPAITTRPIMVDYQKKQAELRYHIPEEVTLEVEVYDGENKLIATLVTSEGKVAGNHSLLYDFSNIGDQASGNRYLRLIAKDRALNETEVTTEVFAVVPNRFQIAEHFATPNPFTPNGDGHTDQVRITYRLSGGVEPYLVSVVILDASGATVKRLLDGEMQSAGVWSFYWDGKNEGGRTIDDGRYEYVIIAEDKLGSSIKGQGTILAVSTRPTVDISTNYPIFSPNGDGSKDTVTFSYSINYPTFYISGEALVKLEVLNSSGEAVWSKVFNHTAGSFVYEWDGGGTE
ncbi:MAG: FlgD immunoglobulin-like domain containing protein, partial [Candidatus Margulisiibacteriota bacterium]